MILPSKDSPVLQRACPDNQNKEAFKAAINTSAGSGVANKNNSKSLHSLFLYIMV